VEDEAVGKFEAIGEDGFLVSFPVIITVFEDENGVIGKFTGTGDGVAGVASDPEAASVIEADLERVDEFGEVLA